MIISGGSRTNWKFFSRHLVNAQENERVAVAEMRGLIAEDVREALREMDAIAQGTRCKNSFYHANLNTRADEHLTPQQWEQAVDTLERNLHLDGHARFVVEHSKEGRTHRHVVWSRIDPWTMTAVSDSHNYKAHERTSRELEELFGHEPVASTLTRDSDVKRPDRRPDNWEKFRGKRSGIDPDALTEEVTALWNASDSGAAFAAALEEQGYILCRGDRRDFVIIDAAGDDHALGKRITGARAAAVRTRMVDIDRDSLPSVAEGRALADEQRQAAEESAKREVDEPALSAEEQRAAREKLEDYATAYLQEVANERPAPVWTVEDIEAANTEGKKPARSIRERIADYITPIDKALGKGEDVPTCDGFSFWGRMQSVFTQTIEVVTDWARDRFDSFVAMVKDTRDDRGDEPDPDELDIGR